MTEATAAAWGGRDLTALVGHCAQADRRRRAAARRTPAAVGTCTLPTAREFADAAALFDALRSGQVNAAWTTTADPAVPADVVVLADRKPSLIQAENVVPLYRRNELSRAAGAGLNEVAGELDTAALKPTCAGRSPTAPIRGTVAEGWLAEHPLGH